MELREFDYRQETGAKQIRVSCIRCRAVVLFGFFDLKGVPFQDYYCTPCGHELIRNTKREVQYLTDLKIFERALKLVEENKKRS
jgi:hypothetical protein